MTLHLRALTWRMRPVTLTTISTMACMAASAIYAYFIFRDMDGEVVQRAMISSLILPVFLGTPTYFLLIRKLRALAFKNLRLKAQSARDGLTHCLNQTAFRSQVETFLQACKGKVGVKGALLVIDADYFKLINDQLGHDKGDEALRLIADSVRSMVRRGDFVGRIGGEEFAVFLRDADLKSAQRVAERIRESVDLSEFIVDGTAHRLSVSVGAVAFEDSVTFPMLFRNADELLYAAKSAGRNRVEVGQLQPVRANAA